MELWIRSQKGLILKKVDQVYTEFKGTEGIYFVRDNSDVLGEYETNERALEVLDEIQRLMIASLVDKNLDGYGVVIYEMPKE